MLFTRILAKVINLHKKLFEPVSRKQNVYINPDLFL